MTKSGVLFGAHSLVAGNGGIARVARLMAHVLLEEATTAGIPVRSVLLGDKAGPEDLSLPALSTRGSKIGFILAAFWASRHCHHFIFDGCHLAQTHSLPWLRRARMMTFIHGVEIWENAKPGYVASARRADILLANSQYTLDRAQALHGPLPHARICWLATEGDDPSPASTAPAQRQVLVIGRLEAKRYKGHREMIACWPQVVSAVPDATLTIVGEGPDGSELRRLANQSTVASQIKFKGFVPESEMSRLFGESMVFAMPSRGEGFGLVYIEAMRHGLPVIASRHDAAPEVIVDGDTGYTVDLDRGGELADRLISLLRDPARSAQMGANGQRRWAEHFRYSCFRDRFRPILNDFLRL